MGIAKRYTFYSKAALRSSELNTNFDDIISAFNNHTHTGIGTDAPIITNSGIAGNVHFPYTTQAYSTNPGTNAETAVVSVTAKSVPYASTCWLYYSTAWNMSAGAPNYSFYQKIRLTNVAGTQLHVTQAEKGAAGGIGDIANMTNSVFYTLPANTAQVFVGTIACDIGVAPAIVTADNVLQLMQFIL